MSTVLDVTNNNSVDSSSSLVDIDRGNYSTSSVDYELQSKNFIDTMGGLSIPHHGLSAAFHNYQANNNINNNKSPFLLPAQLYKSLFASAMLQQKSSTDKTHFSRNFLFSNGDKSSHSDIDEIDEKSSIIEEVVIRFFFWYNFICFHFFVLRLQLDDGSFTHSE